MEPLFNGARALHTRLLLCLLFIYISSNLESVHHHNILSGFVSPTLFRFVRLRIHIAPIKLCRLFAYAQISTIFELFFFCSDNDVFVCHSLSLLLPGCSSAIRRPFNHEWDYFIIYFLSGALGVFRLFAFEKVNKVWHRARRALWVRCIFHYALFLKYLFFSLFSRERIHNNNSYCVACVRNMARR